MCVDTERGNLLQIYLCTKHFLLTLKSYVYFVTGFSVIQALIGKAKLTFP